MMREILETIDAELKRLAAEGESLVPLTNKSVAILGKLARLAAAEDAPAQAGSAEIDRNSTASASVEETKVESASRRSSAQSTKKRRTDEDEEPVEEIKFVEKIDMKKYENAQSAPQKIKIIGGDFEIAPIPAPTPFTLPDGDKKTKWEFLKNRVLGDSVCAQHLKPNKKVVFGVGNLDAKIFFCGEAPGTDEEIQGEPFVGRAGQLLTKIIAAMGLKREDVYIGNIMNWRPELPTSRGNRAPEAFEMAYCLPYLLAQIEIVKPRVVVALGGTAVAGLLGPDPTRRLGKIRGTWQKYHDTDLMVTYHPSFLLQYASNQMKRYVWEDMMAVMERVGMQVSEKQRGYFMAK